MKMRKMFTRLILSFGACLLLLPLTGAMADRDRVRVDVGLLAKSRGGNNTKTLTQLSCDALNNIACPPGGGGGICSSCDLNSYTGTMPGGPGGGYDEAPPKPVGCGLNFPGVCAGNGCAKGVVPAGICGKSSEVLVEPIQP